MKNLFYSTPKLEFGHITVISSDKGLTNLFFDGEEFQRFKAKLNGNKLTLGGKAEIAAREIELYLRGELRNFGSQLDITSGTSFQMKVWKELIEIPYGKVNTYKELASNIGNPNAFRAVGNAVGSNPIPIIIPCHRIVASNGLGGYSAGLRIKMMLLKLEGAIS